MVKRAVCSYPGCKRPAHAKGYCQKHYDKVRRAGARRSEGAGRKCKVSGCGRPYHAKGLCQQHYDLYRKRSGAQPSARADGQDPGVCVVPGCNKPHHAKGYCKSHYSQLRRRGGVPETPKPAGICEVEGCNRPAVAHGRCARHMGHPTSGSKRRLSKSERLKLIKERHEIISREIAMINKALEDDD